MSNELNHNKWHGFNHFTVPIEGFPDSATDPIASKNYPFRGIFYNSIFGKVSGAELTNSLYWWFYSSLTKANSSWWEKYPTVLSTTVNTSSNWDSGFDGYTTLKSNSANYDTYYTSTYLFSGYEEYDKSGGIFGNGGKGWHITLSSVNHRLNKSQSNIKQKVAVPVKLYEKDKTVSWDLSAQTVYVNLTGNYSLSAIEVKNLKKGGRYTFWAYIDRCPEDEMNLEFNKDYFSIAVKTLSGSSFYQSLTNVIRLSSSSITRIDFTCDGVKMLGKATQYSIWVPTEKDLYFKGSGILITNINTGRNKSPVYVSTSKSGSPEPNEWLAQGNGIQLIEDYFTYYTSTSSFYVDGPPLSGIKMRFLTDNKQYFNFSVNNANWASTKQLTYSIDLTGSFDRIVGTLSGKGDFKNPIYANNLICSPGADNIIDSIQLSALPSPPYDLVTSNLREVNTCVSSYEVEIYSGKDRDIEIIYLNGNQVDITPTFNNGSYQPYNFLNERTCSLKFVRVQEDNTIDVYFKPQKPLTIPNNILWFNSLDNSLINKENGPILDFYISWNLGTNTVTSYNPGDSIMANELDRPRINTFRTDGSFIKYLSAGFEVLSGGQIFYPWDNRLSGYEIVSIPVPGSLSAGVDFFTGSFLTPPNLFPNTGWNSSVTNPEETNYKFVKPTTDYISPITPISIGVDAQILPWPVGSYPTIKTWETTLTPQSLSPLTAFYSNTLDNKKLFQYNISNAPNIVLTNNLRSIELNDGKFMTLNTQLTVLSANVYFKPFTTFTVISTTNTFSNSSILWWLGEFNTTGRNKGYGLLLSGKNLYTTSQFTTDLRPAGTLSANNLHIITTNFGSSNLSNRIIINGVGSSNRNLTNVDRLSNFNFIIGKNPEENTGYCNGIKLFDFYMFNRALSRGELLQMNAYLKDKFDTFR